MLKKPVEIYAGTELAAYGFPNGHPFSLFRHDAFIEEINSDERLKFLKKNSPVTASIEILQLFHTPDYVDFVKRKSQEGHGFLDSGDTPVFPGVYEAACFVVGSAVEAADRIMRGIVDKVFIPVAGLHHARRDRAAGFCVFNDCGVVLEFLLQNYGLKKIAYVDIDAHHGDGIYYGFIDNPHIIFADIHESPQSLYPGTGFANELGEGSGLGYKLNIEMNAGAVDKDFFLAWDQVMNFLNKNEPEFILFQCGADSVAGDPLTHLQYSSGAHTEAALQLARLADRFCQGKMLAVGGGGYNLTNIQKAWAGVVRSMSRIL